MGVWDRLLRGSTTRRGAEALELERCSARAMAWRGKAGKKPHARRDKAGSAGEDLGVCA